MVGGLQGQLVGHSREGWPRLSGAGNTGHGALPGRPGLIAATSVQPSTSLSFCSQRRYSWLCSGRCPRARGAGHVGTGLAQAGVGPGVGWRFHTPNRLGLGVSGCLEDSLRPTL